MTDQSQEQQTEPSNSVTNVSGGVNANAERIDVGGDVVGRDKILHTGGHLIIAAEGSTVIIGGGEATADSESQAALAAARDADAPPHRGNPFYIKGRINDPALFFGRERLVREIRDELSKRNSVSLVGASQIGKSSLLYYLYATRAAWLPDTAVEYLDLQRVLDEADFCETLLKKLGAAGNTLRQVKQTLETREVILLLDEVERIAEPDFSTRLHDLLRSLAQEPTFAMCLVTQRPLEEVFPPRLAGGVSPFHNVFTRKTLGPFTEAECRRFLASRLALTQVTFTARDIERLLRDSQCHPAELQRLAKELFAEKIE